MRAVLSPGAYRAAWERLELGAMPIVLYVEDPAAPEQLTEHMQGSELDPWLVAAFKLIAHPTLAIDLRAGFGSTKIRALATGNVLAVLTDQLTITEIDDPIDALVSLPKDQKAQFGAAATDAGGRRHRAEPVVTDEGVTQEALKARITAMVDTIRSIVDE